MFGRNSRVTNPKQAESKGNISTENDEYVRSDNRKTSAEIKRSDRDALGNALIEAQQSYFAEFKIRDENGNLKVMYHGSPETLTVFDKKKAKSFGAYGKGFYFTDSISHADTYGEKPLTVYLNITNPLQNSTHDITKERLRNFVEAKGEYVSWVQAKLKELGFYDGPVCGASGPLTMNAVYAFQRKYRLGVGWFGTRDWDKIVKL